MILSVEWIVEGILRASLGLAVSALLVTLFVSVLRVRAPRAEQIAWALVLAQGLLLAPVPIAVSSHWLTTATNSKPQEPIASTAFGPERMLTRSVQNTEHARATGVLAADHPQSDELSTGSAVVEAHLKKRSSALSWPTIIFATWLVGIFGCLGLGWLRYRSFARQLNASRDVPSQWQSEWRQVLEREQVSVSIPLVATTDIGPALSRTPAGFRLAVPRRLWSELVPAQRLSILRHELAHFRRGDIWRGLFARGVALLHWFNPVAWWAVAQFERQLEFACDRAAADEDPATFAGALIQLGSPRRWRPAVAQSSGNRSLVERVRRLLGEVPLSSRWKAIVSVAVAVIALAAMAIRLQAVSVADGQDSLIEPVKPTTIGDAERTANALLQIGTNNLRTRDFIRDIAFSPKGDLIAAAPANGETPRVWIIDVRTGRERKRIIPTDKPRAWITCLAFSPDQSKLLWGECDGFVALWDLVEDHLLFREKLHLRAVNDVSFSTAGQLIASAGSDGVIHLRRTSAPKQTLRRFEAGQQQLSSESEDSDGSYGVRSLAFTPDDTRVIAGTGTNAEITVWRVADGLLLRRIKNAHGQSTSSANPHLSCLAVTPEGRRIMSSGQTTVPITETNLKYGSKRAMMSEVRFWDIETGKRLQDLRSNEDYGFGYAALSHDGKRVAVGDFARLKIIDAVTGDSERTISLPGSWGRRPEFSPDGKLVAMPINNCIGLFEVATGQRLHHDKATPAGGVASAAWTRSGNGIVTGHDDGGVRMWDAQTGRLIWHEILAPVISRSGWNARPAFVACSADGRRIVVAGRRDDPIEWENGIVAVYDAADGRLLRKTHLPEVRGAALSPDGKLLVAGSSHGSADDSRLHGIEVDSGKILYTTPSEDVRGALWEIKAMQFRPGTTLLDVALMNSEVIRFDARTGKEQRRFVADWRSEEQLEKDRPRRHNLLWEAAFSQDGRTLVSSAYEYVCVWDVDTGKMRMKIRHPHDHGCRISIAPDGKTFATSDLQYAGDYGQDTILLYDLSTGKPIMKAEPDDNRACVLVFSPDSTKLFSGFYRGSATVWDFPVSRRR